MKEIIAVIKDIRAKVKPIAHDADNQHGGYTYVSIDKYYQTIGKIANDAGLVWRTREIAFDFLEGQGRSRDRTYVKAKFAYDLYHGDHAFPDYMTVTILNPIDGAQTTGQLYSYADKVFMRVAFCVVTGEKDADANRQEEINVSPARPTHSPAGEPMGFVGNEYLPIGPPEVPPHDPETGELLPAKEEVVSRIKDDLPLIDTRKVDVNGVKIIEEIFNQFLPQINSRAKLTDYHAENLAAIEKVNQYDPAAYGRIKAMFNKRFGELPSGKK